MSKIKDEMYKAMESSGWWPIGEQPIKDMTDTAMTVTSIYTDSVLEVLLNGLDDSVKINMIKDLHHDLMSD